MEIVANAPSSSEDENEHDELEVTHCSDKFAQEVYEADILDERRPANIRSMPERGKRFHLNLI